MRFFKRFASQDSLPFDVDSKNASNPPLCSIVRKPREEIRNVTVVPNVSLSNETACKFGKNRRRLLLLA